MGRIQEEDSTNNAKNMGQPTMAEKNAEQSGKLKPGLLTMARFRSGMEDKTCGGTEGNTNSGYTTEGNVGHPHDNQARGRETSRFRI